MNVLHHRMAVIGGKSYNRIPLKMLKAIPAGFPLPLHDDMFGVAGHSDAIFSNIQSAGEDLRAFTDLAMTNEIPLEIVTITTGSSLIKGFVRVPSALSINDKIYLRTTMGGGETAYAVTDTNGRNNVWQDYSFVMHGSDLTADVSGNLSAGTNTGGVSKSGADLLNGWPCYGFGAREGTASTDILETPSPTGAAVSTESMLFFKDATEDSAGAGRFVQWQGLDWETSKQSPDGLRWRRKATTTNQSISVSGAPITGGDWHYLGALWPALGSAPTFRHNGGSLAGSVVNGAGTLVMPSANLYFANLTSGGLPADIRMAEYRYRPDNTPTTAWLDLEWDCFNNPGAIAEAEALAVV